jgi:hypothetical protein
VAVAQAARTYRALSTDLTHVRLLSAAGLHRLACVGQVQDERQGVVHLVCALLGRLGRRDAAGFAFRVQPVTALPRALSRHGRS